MMQRGEREGHFKFLSKEETGAVLSRPHYFCSSTVSWKDSGKRKVRHVSNPSAINKLAGRSLNMLQKVPANTANNPLWPIQNFFLQICIFSRYFVGISKGQNQGKSPTFPVGDLL